MAAPQAPNISTALPWDSKAAPVSKPARKKGNPLALIAALALAALCVSGAWRATHQAAPQEWVKVVGAAQDIPCGTRLNYTSLRYVQFPRQFLSKEMATNLPDVVGHVSKTFIPQGEPIRSGMVFANRKGLSYDLETHERALTLQLSDDALVDHAIGPDDRVDVLVVASKNGNRYTKTICQDVKVLMSTPKEQTFARRGGGSNSKITLAVSGDAVESIAEAAEVGKIRLLLRSRLTHAISSFPGCGPDDLLPASALRPEKINNSPAALSLAPVPARTPMQLLGMTLPPPPAFEQLVKPIATAPSAVDWIVEMFAGNRKETLTVPAH